MRFISIMKYIGSREAEAAAGAGDVAKVISSYRAALKSIAVHASTAAPVREEDIRATLLALERHLAPTADGVSAAQTHLDVHLAAWAQHAAAESKQKADQIKEILLALAKAAEAVGGHGQSYATQLAQITEHFERIGSLDDITQIRQEIEHNVAHLRNHVEQMSKEREELVHQLQSKVSTYESKLKSAENLARTDGLTGVTNRRGLEEFIAACIQNCRTFCIAILDLNQFKLVNDQFGHNVGDFLLKKFAQNLRACVRDSDYVGRWGGDEFVIVVQGNEKSALTMLARIRSQVFTQYMIQSDADGFMSPLYVDAAIGLAEWQLGETLHQLAARADAEMYKNKEHMNRLR